MRNYDIQSKLISDTLTSQNALNLALVDKKGISNHLKMTTTAETPESPSKFQSKFKRQKEPTTQNHKTKHTTRARKNRESLKLRETHLDTS